MAANEVLLPSLREINFYGEGKAVDIKLGFAFVTLRNPNPNYEFERGEVILANCVDDGIKIPTVALGTVTKPLGEYGLPFLALDGFLSHEQAVEGMRRYPTYENTSLQTSMQAIVLIQKSTFDSLTSEEQTQMVKTPVEKLAYQPALRRLFFPTMCYWFTQSDRKTSDWINFLATHRLLSTEETEKLRKLRPKRGKLLGQLDVLVLNGPEDPLLPALFFGHFEKG